MTSFGRLQAALAAVTNEVTLTAANLNFDFTLIKCEAPKEFQQLGSNLSKRRKEDAECGATHITARRLGALFEGILPSTPRLLQAYGSRVSQIAQIAGESQSPEPENTMFAAHTGIDGTSIWAAATSSSAALHVQLLACMLARVWTASEAISVWFELVKERRKEIEEKWHQGEPVSYPTLAAATQSPISRASLAEWDASTRSWLKTADRAKMKQQDQLMLLVSNVNVPINKDMAVYHSVIAAWKTALESMEKLVKGMPQAVNDGACLLALSSWHIYPDILVAGSGSSHTFQDVLVQPGGTLTLGLNIPSGEKQGVFWCLSLAHLNCYGRPVENTARLSLQTRTITFEQFTQAMFGAFLSHWGLVGHDSVFAAQFLISLRAEVERAVRDVPKHQFDRCSTWLRDPSQGINILARAARDYMDAKESKTGLIHKLIELGSKRAPKLLPGNRLIPFLGFSNIGIILFLLKGPDERVALLRRIASSFPIGQHKFIIRYFNPLEYDDGSLRFGRYCGLASVHDNGSTHSRWVPKVLLDGKNYPHEMTTELADEMSLQIGAQRQSFNLRTTYTQAGPVLQTFEFVYGLDDCAAIYKSVNIAFLDDVAGRSMLYDNHPFAGYLGDVPQTSTEFLVTIPLPTIQDLTWCLQHGMFSVSRLVLHLAEMLDILSPQSLTLEALSLAHRIYRALPNATLSTQALNSPLYLTKWASYGLGQENKTDTADSGLRRRLPTNRITQAAAFACIGYFETGFDINPDLLKKVFAIAYEDSIYVSMQLTCDPWDQPNAYELKRVTGNIGKPGLTLLIPPRYPMIRQIDDSSWRLISSNEYNGLQENHFMKTSMHLSFTDYYVPFVGPDDDSRGQDRQIYIVESVVSVHSSGGWVGDVDIQRCLSSAILSRQLAPNCHEQHDDGNSTYDDLKSIENWEDVLDPPTGNGVIRANGSWLARLATATIFVQAQMTRAKEEEITSVMTILDSSACGKCAFFRARKGPSRGPSTYGTPISDRGHFYLY